MGCGHRGQFRKHNIASRSGDPQTTESGETWELQLELQYYFQLVVAAKAATPKKKIGIIASFRLSRFY